MAEFFASKDWQTFLDVLPSIPAETWDTFYSTVVATLFALVIGLPLGVRVSPVVCARCPAGLCGC